MGKQTVIDVTTISDDYVVFAISSTNNDIQCCMAINQIFGVSLQGKEPKNLSINRRIVQPSCFTAFDPNNRFTITLIDNQTNGGPFLDFLKNVSYFVKISPLDDKEKIADIQKYLSSNPDFLFVQSIDENNLKPQQKKMFDGFFQFL